MIRNPPPQNDYKTHKNYINGIALHLSKTRKNLKLVPIELLLSSAIRIMINCLVFFMKEMISKIQLRKLDFEFLTGLAIKNGHQRKWFYTIAGGLMKKWITTFVPYFFRYWNNKHLLHLAAFIFSYGLQLIRSESTDFTRMTHLRYR